MKTKNGCSEQFSNCCWTKVKSLFSRLWRNARRVKWWGWLLLLLAFLIFCRGLAYYYRVVRWNVITWHEPDRNQQSDDVRGVINNYWRYDRINISERLVYFSDKDKRYGRGGYLIDMKDSVMVDTLDWVALNGSDSLVVVAKDGKRGYMDRYSGEMAIPFKYVHAWVFSEGIAAVSNGDGDIVFINRDGRRAMDKVFDYYDVIQGTGYVFHYNHCVLARAVDSVGLIDRNGEWAVKPVWRQILWRDYYWELRTEEKIMLLAPDLKQIMPATMVDKLANTTRE